MEEQKIHIDYDDIHNIVCGVSERISKDFDPEVIIGIGGGGLLPARLYRSALGIPMYAVFISFYEDNKEKCNESSPISQ